MDNQYVRLSIQKSWVLEDGAQRPLWFSGNYNSHGISRARCFLTLSFGFGRKNSVSCTIPYGVMQETLFLPSSDNELYNLHATNPYRHISCHR